MQATDKLTTTPVQFALRYAVLGWAVFPCRENDKRPIVEHGLKDATTDGEMIHRLWRENPRANIGVCTGAHFWVLDIDPRHGGHEALAALEDAHGEIPETLTAKTPSGGTHYFFHPVPDIRNSAGKVGRGIDVRGHGGYVCVEGSRVEGAGYAFQDWDPLTDAAPELSIAPKWLTDLAIGRSARKASAASVGGRVSEGGRNDALAREAGRMRRIGLSTDAITAALQRVNLETCDPPLDDEEVAGIARSVGRYEPQAPAPSAEPTQPQQNILNWRALSQRKPPPFQWLIEHWLSWHPTLLAGRGGIGKSLLAQQIATGIAIGRPLWSSASGPAKVLYWACEDDHDEIWRRQDRICASLGIGFEALDNLVIDARCGLANALFATDFGRPALQPLFGKLMEQVNDLSISVLILDNIAQTFGGNENDRHHVTMFLNHIIGLVRNRPFCPIVLGHIAKSPTSEYSGSTAWENAARMRWYLAEKLPDEAGADQAEIATDTTETRFLCKRKTNYSATDFVQFGLDAGLLKPVLPDVEDDGGTMSYLRAQRALTVVLQAVGKLTAIGIYCSESSKSGTFLPSKIVEMKLSEGYSKAELRTAMNALLVDGRLKHEQVGHYANRTPRFGLKVAQ
jgi:hypothetical protein